MYRVIHPGYLDMVDVRSSVIVLTAHGEGKSRSNKEEHNVGRMRFIYEWMFFN